MKKESNSFEDALKRVLLPEKKEKKTPKPKRKKRSNYVSEAIGGNTASPTTVSAQGGRAGGASGMPPFAKHTSDTGSGSVDMRDIGREEDTIAKSHGIKPYPLDTVIDFIAQSGENLQNAQSMIETSLRKNDVSLTPEQKKMLKDAQQTIKSSLGNICKAAKSINSINLN